MNDEIDEEFNWELKPPYHKFVWGVIRLTGWYIIGISVILIYTWPYISKVYSKLKKKKDDMEYDAKYRKNDDLNVQLMLATQQAREKMHEKFLKEREIALQKEKEKREKKLAQQSIPDDQQLDDSTGSSSLKARLKKEYNPLMGDNSGRYKPTKRSCCGKGGCG